MATLNNVGEEKCEQYIRMLEEKNRLLKTTLSSLEAEINSLREHWDKVEQAKPVQTSQQL